MSKHVIPVLLAVARYYTMTRAQIQRVVGIKNDRFMRELLLKLVRKKLLNKTRMEVVNPGAGAPAPVYYPSRTGCEFLAAELKDDRYLRVMTRSPDWTKLYHWCELAERHWTLDRAVELHGEAALVTVGGWLNEYDVANPDEREPQKRYSLYTLLREKPRLVCAPDAAMLLCVRSYAKIYYWEIDRGTSGVSQIAASKTPGYALMAIEKTHRRHFETNCESFTVLSLSPSAGRRDLLRSALAKKEGAPLWRFASATDFTPESLYGAIWYPCEGDAQPLVKPPAEGAGTPAGSGSGTQAGRGAAPAPGRGK